MEHSFKYNSIFNKCFVKASLHSEIDKYLSQASLEKLKSLPLPDSLDLSKNPDLIVAMYNGAVINRMNKNGDCIAAETILKSKDLFLHKPTNIEHTKSRVVGHIVSIGWSTFGGNELLSNDETKNMEEPFNMVVGSVVYRLNEQKFSDRLIEASDESSAYYNTLSASWELGFDDYHLMLGSKNLNEAEIITDPKKIKELRVYTKAFGGKGVTPNNEIIGRLIVGEPGELLPYGFAFTTNPAADVEGVTSIDFSDLLESENNASEASEVADDEVNEDKFGKMFINLENYFRKVANSHK